MKLLSLVELPLQAKARLRSRHPELELLEVERGTSAFADALAEAQIIAGSPTLAELAQAKRLRWLQLGSAGADRYIEHIPEHVQLTTASGVFGPSMAEHLFAMMLALERGLDRVIAVRREAKWASGSVRGGVLGKTLLIVGLGDIGSAVALRAKAFGMHVIGVRRRLPAGAPACVDQLVAIDALDTVLPRSDHVALIVPATRDTDRLFDRRRLDLMKPRSFLYNIGRGNAVDEAALVEVLRAGHLAGAGLDVFATEPLPPSNALWQLDNVIVSPHCAGYTPGYRSRFAEILLENVERYLDRRELENRVDRVRGY
jgi:phosphoglycerate dehydrogenase-like enzyme